jgi:hypothetical protein
MAEKPRFVIACDFDGWITDLRKDAKGYYNRYVEAFGDHVQQIFPGYDKRLTRPLMNMGLDHVYKHPGAYGWDIDGKGTVVAAAESDPYQLTKAAAQIAIGLLGTAGLTLPKDKTVNDFLNGVFQEAYAKSEAHFRGEDNLKDGEKPEALTFIETMMAHKDEVELVFTTNSKTDEVKNKLGILFERYKSDLKVEDIRVQGDAKKQVKDDDGLKHLPDNTLSIPGIPRTIYTGRKQYVETIRKLHADLATGDNIEMDILPMLAIGRMAMWMDTTVDGPYILADEVPVPEDYVNPLAVERDYLLRRYPEQFNVVTSLGQATQAILALAKMQGIVY